jgi:hypothetical protein
MSDTTNPQHGGTAIPHAGGVDPAAIARGHEIDSYDSKSVLSVPLLVVVFFALAFTTVTIIFSFVSKSLVDPNANPQAVADNDKPINEKLGEIDRSSGGPTDQPRLEDLRMRKGDARGITQPEMEKGNSPFLHPEDIHPSETNTPELYKTGPVPGDKGASRLRIDEAMRVALETKKFPTTEAKGTAPPSSEHVPTAANGGRGAADAIALPPKLPDPVEVKKQPEPAGGKK